MKWLKTSSSKNIRVKVSTHESDLELNIPLKSTGKYLFDLVCSSIGLRETWYFGLQCYTQDDKGNIKWYHWLNLEKKITFQRITGFDKTPLYFFHAKFFPEDVEQEIIQYNTRHLFYLQFYQDSHDVGRNVIFHLIALAARADIDIINDEDINDKIDDTILSNKLLRMIPFHILSDDEKLDLNHIMIKVKDLYYQQIRFNKNEAQLQFLKLAQVYRLFGINFFSINCMRIRGLRTRSLARYLNREEVDSLQASNKQYGSAYLGVSASGIQLYDKNNKFKPLYSFSWSIIKNVLYREPKFTVKLNSNWRMTFHQSQITSSTSHQAISSDNPDPCLIMEFNASGSNLSIKSTKNKPDQRASIVSSIQHGGLILASNLSPQSTPSSPAFKKGQKDVNIKPSSSLQRILADSSQKSSIPRSPRGGKVVSNRNTLIPHRIHIDSNRTAVSTHQATKAPGSGSINSTSTSFTPRSIASNKLVHGLSRIRLPTRETFSTRSSATSETMYSGPNSFMSSAALQVDAWLSDPGKVKLLMSLCAGNHALFMRRRQPDTIEVQQMRAQAREEKTQRELERLRLERARTEKAEVLEEKMALESRCARLEHALRNSGIQDPNMFLLDSTKRQKFTDSDEITEHTIRAQRNYNQNDQMTVPIREEDDHNSYNEDYKTKVEEPVELAHVKYRMDFSERSFRSPLMSRKCQTQPNTPLMNPKILHRFPIISPYDLSPIEHQEVFNSMGYRNIEHLHSSQDEISKQDPKLSSNSNTVPLQADLTNQLIMPSSADIVHMRWPRPLEAIETPRFSSPPDLLMRPTNFSVNENIKNLESLGQFAPQVPIHYQPESAASMPVLMSFDPTSGAPLYMHPWKIPGPRPHLPAMNIHNSKNPYFPHTGIYLPSTGTMYPWNHPSHHNGAVWSPNMKNLSAQMILHDPDNFIAHPSRTPKEDVENDSPEYHAHLKHHYVNTDLPPDWLKEEKSSGISAEPYIDVILAPHEERSLELSSEQDSAQAVVPDSSTGPVLGLTPEPTRIPGESSLLANQEYDYESSENFIVCTKTRGNIFKGINKTQTPKFNKNDDSQDSNQYSRYSNASKFEIESEKSLDKLLMTGLFDKEKQVLTGGEHVLSLDRLDQLDHQSNVDELLNHLLTKGDKPRSALPIRKRFGPGSNRVGADKELARRSKTVSNFAIEDIVPSTSEKRQELVTQLENERSRCAHLQAQFVSELRDVRDFVTSREPVLTKMEDFIDDRVINQIHSTYHPVVDHSEVVNPDYYRTTFETTQAAKTSFNNQLNPSGGINRLYNSNTNKNWDSENFQRTHSRFMHYPYDQNSYWPGFRPMSKYYPMYNPFDMRSGSNATLGWSFTPNSGLRPHDLTQHQRFNRFSSMHNIGNPMMYGMPYYAGDNLRPVLTQYSGPRDRYILGGQIGDRLNMFAVNQDFIMPPRYLMVAPHTEHLPRRNFRPNLGYH